MKKKSASTKNVKISKEGKSCKNYAKKNGGKKAVVKYKIKGTGNICKIKAIAKKSKKIRNIHSVRHVQTSGVKLKVIENRSEKNLVSSKSFKKDKGYYLKTTPKVGNKSPQSSTKGKCHPHLKKFFSGIKLQKNHEPIQFIYDRSKSEEKHLKNQIFVSLDALDDDQKPKCRIRNSSGHKGITTSPSIKKKKTFSHKQFLGKSQHVQNIPSEKKDNFKHEREAYNKNCESPKDLKEIFTREKNYKIKNNFNDFQHTNRSTDKQNLLQTFEKQMEFENNTEILKAEKEQEPNLSKVDLQLWPFFPKNETPNNEISKVDKEYMKSLLLVASSKNKVNPTNPVSQIPSNKNCEKKKQNLKIKPSHHQFLDEKPINQTLLKKKKAIKEELLPEKTDIQKKQTLVQNLKSETQDVKKKSNVSILRVLTKSDNRLKKKSQKRNRVESEIEIEKKLACSNTKNTNANNRKRRTFLTNTSRNEQKENHELSFPCRAEDTTDVKEIWRRDNKKESENSLTSRSSTIVADKNELLDVQILGMQSYNFLKRIVEQEVERITKGCKKEKEGDMHTSLENSENKPLETVNDAKDLRKSMKSEIKIMKEVEKNQPEDLLNNLRNQNTILTTKNLNYSFDLSEDEIDFVVKRRMIEAETQKNLKLECPKIENKEIQNNHEFLRRDTSQEIKKKLEKLSEEKTPETKIPSEIIKNWSILHRLQKAFLALGTPNFQSKTSGSAFIKSKRETNNDTENLVKGKGEGGKIKKVENDFTNADLRSLKHSVSSLKSKKLSKAPNAMETTWTNYKKNKNTLKPIFKEEKNAEVLFIGHKSPFQDSTIKKPIFKGTLNNNTENYVKQTLGGQVNKFRKGTVSKTNFKSDVSFSDRTKVSEKSETLSKQKKGNLLNPQANTNNNNLTKITLKSLVKPKSGNKDGDDAKNSKTEGKQTKCKSNFNERSHLKLPKKTDVQIGKFGKRKSSRVLACNINNQTKNVEENLERKRTFDVIPRKDTVEPQKSKSCYKLEKNSQMEIINCFPMTFNQNGTIIPKTNTEFWDFLEESANSTTNNLEQRLTVRKKASGNQPNPSKKDNLKAPFKRQIKEKVTKLKKSEIQSEKPRNLNDKENLKGNAETSSKVLMMRLPQEKKQEKVSFLEELPQRILSARRETNKSNNHERAIKERSILSIRGNQHANQGPLKNLTAIQRNCPPKFRTQLNCIKAEDKDDMTQHSNANLFFPKNLNIEKLSCNGSVSSCTSTGTYDLPNSTLPNIIPSKHFESIDLKKSFHNMTADVSSISTLSTNSFDIVPFESSSRGVDSKFSKPLWERDIRHYRAIVKDIMNQYKRTSRFLKQSTPIRHLKYEVEEPDSQNENDENESPSLLKNDRNINIHEYRKKIMSEYEAVPIFEYKSQIEKNKEQVNAQDAKENRILKTVEILDTELDVDIKDFQPNIHKILDSQIYVDTESLFKRNNGLGKPKEKSPSLQETSLGYVAQDDPRWQRTFSMPKTFVTVKNPSDLLNIFSETPKVLYIKGNSLHKTENLSENSSSTTNITQAESEVVVYL